MASDCQIDVQFFAAPADLAPCFTTIYLMTVDLPPGERVVDMLLPEWANMRFFSDTVAGPDSAALRSAGAQRFQATGPSAQPTRFEIGRSRVWGMGLSPLGWARYVGAEAADFVNLVFDGEAEEAFAKLSTLCEMLCGAERDLDRQFESVCEHLRTAAPMPKDADRIIAVQEAMSDPYLTHVEDFSDRLNLSKRTLERLCKRHCGFSPRVLLRRQRLVRTLGAFLTEPGRWTSVIDRHYHDQAHFVHEFKSFIGMSPSEYVAMPHPVLGAFAAERRRVWGSPVQSLDRRG
ncbi:helix-turn-helix domain-containing protein [Qipengyuania sp. 902]|uniref:AraC family transcriptional regulator n=1 Tax=Qipengyuania sp. 902 TaxID=3417565 RepID=UPI003EC11F57